jgi:hypothetical protein
MIPTPKLFHACSGPLSKEVRLRWTRELRGRI